MTSRLSLLIISLLAAALCADAAGQNVPIAVSAPGGYQIWAADEATGLGQLSFVDVAFQTLDLPGYATRTALRSDRPSLAGAGGATPHIRLPQGGSLYRIHRSDLAAALLHVRADGLPVLAANVALGGAASALLPDIGVSADGTRALMATERAAGGDVLLIDLTAASQTQLTSSLPPLTIDGDSLRVAADRAWFVAEQVLYRADLTAGAVAQPVTLNLPPGDVLLPSLVVSADGRVAVAVSEAANGSRTLRAVDAAGSVKTMAQGEVDPPGYDEVTGPWLALSDDGALLAFRQTVLVRELFVCRTDSPAPPEQLTADANFIDTIDNEGIIGFIGAVLFFVAGEVDPGGTIEAADLFRATYGPGGSTLSNVSLTSGIAAPPFTTKGTLKVLRAYEDPTAERLLLVVDPVGGDSGLVMANLDGTTGLEVLLPALESDPNLISLGSAVLVTSIAANDTDTGVHLLKAGDWTQLGVVPEILSVDRFTHGGGVAGLVASAAPGIELLIGIDLATGVAATMWPTPLAISPSITGSRSGNLSAGFGLAGGPFLFATFDAPLAPRLLGVPSGFGFFLAH